MSSKKKTDDLVILPTGEFVKWNDWTPTEGEKIVWNESEKQASEEYEALKEFFFPKPEPPYPGTLSEQWKNEGRCPSCGELGRIHLSTMVCSKHGPY